MNRLSFLKTMGVGIAAAVITPKILVDALPREASPVAVKEKEKFGHYEENRIHSTDPNNLHLWDSVMNREWQIYIVTAIGFDTIELTSCDIETQPNLLDIKKANFGEYFFIIGSAFCEGVGSPHEF